MNKKLMMLAIVALLWPAASLRAADEGVVVGRIVDGASKEKEALPFVNVAVRRSGEQVYLPIGSTTDMEGKFTLKLPLGQYVLVTSYVGYATEELEVSLSAQRPRLNLGQIELQPTSQDIEAVEVTAMRSQMKFELDKKVFNVESDIATAGASASEVLSNIPSVEVDNEGEISLRGNSSVTVWINGKAAGLSEDNRAQILEQLPAESIEKVEIITNPSAKYSPEGTAGIINIVLKKNRAAGYYGGLQAGVDTRGGYNASVNINYSSSKLDAYANVGFRHFERRSGGFTKRLNYGPIDTTYLNSTSEGRGGSNNLMSRLGLTWHLTDNDHLSVGGFGMFGGGTSENSTNYESNVPTSYVTSSRWSNSDNKMNVANAELGYKHEFGENHTIDLTGSFNRWAHDATVIYTQQSQFGDSTTRESYQKQLQTFDTHSWDVQLDYSNRFSDNLKIEAGYKLTLEREDTPVETHSGLSEASAALDTGLYNRFLYNSDIHAIYSTFSGRMGKFNYQLGLRGELLTVYTKSLVFGEQEANVQPFSKSYPSLYPSVFVAYSLPNDNEIQVNYTRRVRRPRGGQLNSFRNITDPANISFGNPELQPQFANSFELNYIKSWINHTFSLSAYYRNTNNQVERISYLIDNVMYSTFENVAQSASTGGELVLKNRLFKRFELTTTFNAFYYKLNAYSFKPDGATTTVEGRASEDFSWNLRMMANVMLPKSFSVQLNGRYNARQVVAQGYREPMLSLDAGVRKSIKNFNISLNLRDAFNTRRMHSKTWGTGFYSDSERWWGGRSLRLTVAYSFGNMMGKRERRPDDSEMDVSGGYGEGEF
ncbi:MAG: TonB-dependent receptor [Bacteroidales bacterium]|nr:TonB-dependent receptor [Bacteroidales bacterium]